jgi:hypothetical protein
VSNFFSGDFFQDTFMFSFTVAFVSDLVPFSRYTLLVLFYGVSMGFLEVCMGFLWDFYGVSIWDFSGVSMRWLWHFVKISLQFRRRFYGMSMPFLCE